MSLLIQCAVGCLLMAVVVLPAQYKDPLKMIMSYPPDVIRRVEQLPQYQGMIRQKERAHITKKVIGLVFFALVLALVAYLSGCRSFGEAFAHVFTLFFVVNLFDLLVLDWGVFCHSRKLRIPGTEDMDAAYGDRLFHLRGAGIGVVLGLATAALAGGIVQVIGYL